MDLLLLGELIIFASWWSDQRLLAARHFELIRSVLLLLVLENVGNFLLDARMAMRLRATAWAAISISSSAGFPTTIQ